MYIKKTALSVLVCFLYVVSCTDIFIDKIKNVHYFLQWYNKYKKDGDIAQMKNTRDRLGSYLSQQKLIYYHRKKCLTVQLRRFRRTQGKDCGVDAIEMNTNLLIDDNGDRHWNTRFNFVEWIEREYKQVTDLRVRDIAISTGSTLAGAALVGGIALAVGSSVVVAPALIGGAILGGLTSIWNGDSVDKRKTQFVDAHGGTDEHRAQGQAAADVRASRWRNSIFCWYDC